MNLSKLKYLAADGVTALVLSACGQGNCPPNGVVGDLTLAINAPSQYPAGIPVTAYLTMTNTSNVNGTNLVYTVPAATNYTGVTITPYANGAGNHCENIPAHASCTFTAEIPAGSHPGSFTVSATPNAT